MPDHELHDLDAAFASLERDVATLSRPRGAAAAVAHARRRRRTTIGAAAAVALLAVGGVAFGQGIGGHASSLGPAEQPLPAPTELSATAFSRATAGWVDGWGQPTNAQTRSLASVSCLANSRDTTQSLNQSTRQGGAVFGAGSNEVAYVVDLEFPAAKLDAAGAAVAVTATGCKPTVMSTTTYSGGSQVTFYQLPARSGTGDVELWTAQYGDRIALAVLGGTASAPPADVVGHVGDLLIGALQVDSTFTDVSSASASASASASSADFGTVAESDFAAALGSWSNGWQERGTKSNGNPLPCAGDWTSGSSTGFGSSLGTNGEQDFYRFDSADDATASVAALAGNLRTCASSPASVTTVGGPGALPVTIAVGSATNGRVTWVVQRAATVGLITIPGRSAPPDSVSETVAGLLANALNHVSEGSPPVESSSLPPKLGDDTSSSSSSTAAPQG